MNAGLTAACAYTTQHAHARHLFQFLQLHSVVLSLFSQSQVRAESNEELQTFRSERTPDPITSSSGSSQQDSCARATQTLQRWGR